MRPPLIGRLGKSIGNRKAVGAAVGLGAVTGLARGLGSQDISGGVYEMATGQADIDNYVFGTDMGLLDLAMPNPRLLTVPGTNQRVSPRDIRMMRGALGTRHSAARRSGYYENNLPTVNGDLVLGAYHSRMG